MPEYRLYSKARDAMPERRAQRKQFRASTEHKKAYSLYYRNYKYGLSAEQQRELLVAQNGKCASCGELLRPGKDTHLDHDHVTNKARGFLCCQCNVAIGMMRDSPLLLRKAATYLERYGRREPMRLSASQIQTFVDCQRKWAWRVIEGVEEPASEAAERGRAVHAALEGYLSGGEIDFTTEIGYIAAAGLQHLPKPGADGLRIEQEFHFEGPSGHTYLGYKDLEEPGVIYDHKTTSDLRWQKTPEQLENDIQATLYATDYFRTHPEDNDVELRWIYYQTRNAKKSARVSVRVDQRDTWKRFLAIEKIAEEMSLASTRRALDLAPSISHCSAYGGCPHQGRCNLSPFEKMRSHVEQNKLTQLLRNKNGGAAATPPPVDGTGRPLHAFAPGGAHAAPTGNKLLAKLHGAGAPAAQAVLEPAINPPERQPPPAPASVAAASAELAESISVPSAAVAEKRGRGRPKAATVPATGIAPKIKTLYINCGPVGVPVLDAGHFISLAKKTIAEGGLADYRFAEYGQGPGMLAVAVVAEIDALEGVLPALRLDTTTPEGSIVAVELQARAEIVVR